ncbi:uncharacterized protein LOC110466405 [Mizuhopecten yessoensis]|uniref:uncharacterized protein LOC110466405 n=1 Tax=Mizuhopecten yessoensis TaxID=6573 RepID=UPI000B4573CD|nr:uncharacterized protein LOC110466405 [Mizuhopecten yessoensis]
MDSLDSEQRSVLLSTFLDHKFTGTQKEVDIIQRSIVLQEHLENTGRNNVYQFLTGSHAKGFYLPGSDEDVMAIIKKVTVMYPDQCISPHMAHKTILYMREADCRPGYVKLQFGQVGQGFDLHLYNSLIATEDSVFVSSDKFREQMVSLLSEHIGLKYTSNGPSCTANSFSYDSDTAFSFPCNCWPEEANEWITRTRLYGWPQHTLIDKIVHCGCHLVAVGDKCSEETNLQWRISFVTAERSLVHSFSHIQFKVYALLKYFLKQIKDTLKEDIGDDDILCSYFLKTTLFHAIENSSQMFWQEKNLFYCFWFCFNTLIAWVKAGYCPNYFIPTNNLFQRKVHGQHQQILLDILNKFCKMKWMCLSIGTFYKPSMWEELSNVSKNPQFVCPKTAEEISFHQDTITASILKMAMAPRDTPLGTIREGIDLLSRSQSDFEDIYTYHYAMMGLQRLATEQAYPDHMVATNNKTKYRSLKKCKHWMIPSASMGTELLRVATFHFLTGNFSKSLDMCKQSMDLASCFTDSMRPKAKLHPQQEARYRHEYCRQGQTLDRLQKIFANIIFFDSKNFYPPHLCLEMLKDNAYVSIPPLPYAVFLSFLCYHKLGDTIGCDAALHQLIELQHDKERGGHKYWIVHTLLGICYQILRDSHRAIRAYWESAQSKTAFHEWNPAIKRIAVVCLCMYVSQTSDRG